MGRIWSKRRVSGIYGKDRYSTSSELLDDPAVTDMIKTVMHRLPVLYRFCALMALCEEMSCRDISLVMGISEPNAKVMVKSTRKKMLSILWGNQQWRPWHRCFNRIVSVPVMTEYMKREVEKIPTWRVDRVLKNIEERGVLGEYEQTQNFSGG